MRVGICGFSGSGRTTVFSALATNTWSERGVTYGRIQVPDGRVDRLARIFSPKKTTFAEITFMDVGGGGRVDTGAFPPAVVQSMRNADVLVHVVRGFDNPMLGKAIQLDRDVDLFSDEILLLDLAVLERRAERLKKEGGSGRDVEVTTRCVATLEDSTPLRDLELDEADLELLKDVQLLSLKPLITLYNLGEGEWEDTTYAAHRELTHQGDNQLSMGICGSMEAEIADLDEDEQAEFLESLGLGESARDQFIRAAYGLLDLISFLTSGEDECRAWPIRKGIHARKAAGKVHSDIERGFIRAEVYRLDDLEHLGSEAALKSAGKLRVEGKAYIVEDGDIVHFLFNV